MKSHHAGFVSPTLIAGAVAAVIVVGSLGYVKLQSARLEASQAVVEGYKQAGEIAEKWAKGVNERNKAKKEKADADYKRSIVSLQRDNQRLRDSIEHSGGLSGLPATPGSPDRICFDRSALNSAIQDYRRGFLGIAEKGTEAVSALDNAKEWARGR